MIAESSYHISSGYSGPPQFDKDSFAHVFLGFLPNSPSPIDIVEDGFMGQDDDFHFVAAGETSLFSVHALTLKFPFLKFYYIVFCSISHLPLPAVLMNEKRKASSVCLEHALEYRLREGVAKEAKLRVLESFFIRDFAKDHLLCALEHLFRHPKGLA